MNPRIKAAKLLKLAWSYQQPPKGSYFFLSTKTLEGKWRDHPLQWPIKTRDIISILSDNANCYFSPNVYTKPKRRSDNATGNKLLWSDLDHVSPKDIAVRPAIAWESSPNRYAALWRVTSATEDVNKQLTYRTGGDKSGWDSTQVLRVPGLVNHKYKAKPRSKLLWCEDHITKLKDVRLPRKTWQTLQSTANQGLRSDVLWKSYHELKRAGLTEQEVFNVVSQSKWNKFKDRPDQLKTEISKVYTNGVDSNVTTFDKIEMEEVEWIWYRYIARGKITILEGDPDLGKTWVALALATYLSRGLRLPGDKYARSGRTLFMSAEDSPADTLKPRLVEMQADTRKIGFAEGVSSINDDGFEQSLASFQPDLLILDPLVAYLGGQIDLHKANETRSQMSLLSQMAEHYNCAVLTIRHLTKGNRDKSIYRGIGSIDLLAAARSVLFVGRSPNDQNERAIIHIKNNLGPKGISMGYQLKSGFTWVGPVPYSFKQVLAVDIDEHFSGQVYETIQWMQQHWPCPIKKLKKLAENRATPDHVLTAAVKYLKTTA